MKRSSGVAADTGFEQRIAEVRAFTRFYTQRMGVLKEGLLDSSFSLTEARILYELCYRDGPTATELARDLGLDPGYLSRILRSFEDRGLVERTRSKSDRRSTHLALSRQGRKAFAPLDQRSRDEVGQMIGALSEAEQVRLVDALRCASQLLGGVKPPAPPFLLRPHRPGDMGWVVHRHGALYAEEYGWDERFEALVADIVAKFITGFEAKRECCWIAERDGEIVGSVFVVEDSKDVARLRLLLVEPSARGLGLGRRLVDECLRFARKAGYKRMTLWTNDVLDSARHIYETAGFRKVKSERHKSFGHSLVGEIWERTL
jgi:DNA-binding MarR family transcriptional regulator/GNAT superfamily N-acetyltransferase